MPKSIEQIFESIEEQKKLALVHERTDDYTIYYVVMNTPYNMIDVEFCLNFNSILDEIEYN